MKKLTAVILLFCIASTLCFANSCANAGNGSDTDTDSSTTNTVDREDTDNDFIITAPQNEDKAILHMIKDVEALEGWQVGKTEFNAIYYIDDMMEILDGLDWSYADLSDIPGDFDFKIDLYRTSDELENFDRSAFDTSDDSTADTAEAEADTEPVSSDCKCAIQYLINYNDRTVIMKFTDHTSQKLELYAKLGEAEMKMIVLCLKYYFGPLS